MDKVWNEGSSVGDREVDCGSFLVKRSREEEKELSFKWNLSIKGRQ